MKLKGLKSGFLGIILLCLGTAKADSPIRYEAGIGARNFTPIVLVGGIGYKDAVLRIQGLGAHNGPRDYWCGIRGGLLWTFFQELPFNFDVGIGGGYEYAEAPNKMHQAFNNANNGNYLFPYNYRENLDLSLELWAHLYGFYTQISTPIHQFRKHDANYLQWGIGYLVEF